MGQRYDLEVRLGGESATLVTYVETDDGRGGTKVVAVPLVEATNTGPSGSDLSRAIHYPVVLAPTFGAVTQKQTLRLGGVNTASGLEYTMNGKAWPDSFDWTATQHGVTQIFLRNDTMMEHPFHLHGNFLRILSKSGSGDEPGLKDTVLVGGMEDVVIITDFDNPGEWMYHCHIAEHSQAGMMGMVSVAASP